jgi:energy-coupling factor transporter ATP-binding protein EcfA2
VTETPQPASDPTVPPAVLLQDCAVHYAGGEYPAVADVCLQADGGVLLIAGPAGCGKSTLLQTIAGLLPAEGDVARQGRVEVCGRDPRSFFPAERCEWIGVVRQDPASQITAGTVRDEAAFPLQCAGWTADVIDERLREVLSEFGLSELADRDPATLSSGQMQRLAVACALAPRPKLLVADEPISRLDPQGGVAVLEALRTAANEMGVTVVLAEHRVEAAATIADRMFFMREGCLQETNEVAELSPEIWSTIREPLAATPTTASDCDGPLLEADGVSFRYPHSAENALTDVDLTVSLGQRIALLGVNGSGKSTLLRLLAGVETPSAGRIRRNVDVRHVGLALPSPDVMLFCATVIDELLFGPRRLGHSAATERATLADLLAAFDLGDFQERPPLTLSRGQRQRVALAATLACLPDVLLLDEPTIGQDAMAPQRWFPEAVHHVPTMVFATHDLAFAAARATDCVLLDRGRVIHTGNAAETLADEQLLASAGLLARISSPAGEKS